MQYGVKILLQHGVHIGHDYRYRSPYMDGYYVGERKGLVIMDIQQTMFLIRRALRFLTEVVSRQGIVLVTGMPFLGIESKYDMYGEVYTRVRWMPGTITNFIKVRTDLGMEGKEFFKKRFRRMRRKIRSKKYYRVKYKFRRQMILNKRKLIYPFSYNKFIHRFKTYDLKKVRKMEKLAKLRYNKFILNEAKRRAKKFKKFKKVKRVIRRRKITNRLMIRKKGKRFVIRRKVIGKYKNKFQRYLLRYTLRSKTKKLIKNFLEGKDKPVLLHFKRGNSRRVGMYSNLENVTKDVFGQYNSIILDLVRKRFSRKRRLIIKIYKRFFKRRNYKRLKLRLYDPYYKHIALFRFRKTWNKLRKWRYVWLRYKKRMKEKMMKRRKVILYKKEKDNNKNREGILIKVNFKRRKKYKKKVKFLKWILFNKKMRLIDRRVLREKDYLYRMVRVRHELVNKGILYYNLKSKIKGNISLLFLFKNFINRRSLVKRRGFLYYGNFNLSKNKKEMLDKIRKGLWFIEDYIDAFLDNCVIKYKTNKESEWLIIVKLEQYIINLRRKLTKFQFRYDVLWKLKRALFYVIKDMSRISKKMIRSLNKSEGNLRIVRDFHFFFINLKRGLIKVILRKERSKLKTVKTKKMINIILKLNNFVVDKRIVLFDLYKYYCRMRLAYRPINKLSIKFRNLIWVNRVFEVRNFSTINKVQRKVNNEFKGLNITRVLYLFNKIDNLKALIKRRRLLRRKHFKNLRKKKRRRRKFRRRRSKRMRRRKGYLWFRLMHFKRKKVRFMRRRAIPSVVVVMKDDRNRYNIYNEASRKGVPSIGVVDSDMILHMVMYGIVGNNDMLNTIQFYMNMVKRSIIMGYASKMFIHYRT